MTEAELLALAERYYTTVRFELHAISMSRSSWDRMAQDYSDRMVAYDERLGISYTFQQPLLDALRAGKSMTFQSMRGAVRISLDATLPEGTCCVLNDAGDVIEEIRTPKE